MAKNSTKGKKTHQISEKRLRGRIRRENAAKRQSAKEAQEYPVIPVPLATFEILPKVLNIGASNNVVVSVQEIPWTKNFEGQYEQDGTVQHLKIAVSVQTLLAYHALVALLGSGARAKEELRAQGIGDIDYRLVSGRRHLANRTAFETEDELRRLALHRYAALVADPEAATGALGEKVLAETTAVRLVFRAYQRAQLVLEAKRKIIGKSASDSAERLERAHTHPSSQLSPIEACQVAYFADVNPAELWIHYLARYGMTFEFARLIGRINAGLETKLGPELFGIAARVIAAEADGSDLHMLWITLRQLLKLTLSADLFECAVRGAECVAGIVLVSRRQRELSIERPDGLRHVIVAT